MSGVLGSFLAWGIGLAPLLIVWTVATLWGLIHFKRHPVPSALVALGFGVFLLRQLLWIGPQAWAIGTGDVALHASVLFRALALVRLALGVVQIALIGAAGLVGRGRPTEVDP